jgi:nucleoside-diphosphate-sugar epimerase
MTTLIIGAGMIGSFVAKEFIDNNQNVVIVGNNPDILYIQRVSNIKNECILNKLIVDETSLLEIINHHKVTNLIICAGMMTKHFEHNAGASIVSESHLLLSIYNAVRDHQDIKRITYVSSFGVYGPNMLLESEMPKPQSIYGAIKYYNENILQKLHFYRNDIPISIIRPIGVLGPCPEKSGNWLSQMVRSVYLANHSISIQSNQCKLRVLDVRDLSKGIFKINQINKDIDTINIGNDKYWSIKDFIQLMEQCFNKKIKLISECRDGGYEEIGNAMNKLEKKYYQPVNYELSDSFSMIGDFYHEYS